MRPEICEHVQQCANVITCLYFQLLEQNPRSHSHIYRFVSIFTNLSALVNLIEDILKQDSDILITHLQISVHIHTVVLSPETLPSHHQGQGPVRALHQRDGLLPGAAEGDGVHAHHFIAGLETDCCRHAALLHLNAHAHVHPSSGVS